jgi:hypothetical protein
MASRLRWLVVVQRERGDLYWSLRRRFAGRAHVLLDRRKGEQRKTALPIVRERRRGLDPRQPITLVEQHLWENFGYRLVYKADGFEVDGQEPL